MQRPKQLLKALFCTLHNNLKFKLNEFLLNILSRPKFKQDKMHVCCSSWYGSTLYCLCSSSYLNVPFFVFCLFVEEEHNHITSHHITSHPKMGTARCNASQASPLHDTSWRCETCNGTIGQGPWIKKIKNVRKIMNWMFSRPYRNTTKNPPNNDDDDDGNHLFIDSLFD